MLTMPSLRGQSQDIRVKMSGLHKHHQVGDVNTVLSCPWGMGYTQELVTVVPGISAQSVGTHEPLFKPILFPPSAQPDPRSSLPLTWPVGKLLFVPQNLMIAKSLNRMESFLLEMPLVSGCPFRIAYRRSHCVSTSPAAVHIPRPWRVSTVCPKHSAQNLCRCEGSSLELTRLKTCHHSVSL